METIDIMTSGQVKEILLLKGMPKKVKIDIFNYINFKKN
jgi:hypothetical protein